MSRARARVAGIAVEPAPAVGRPSMLQTGEVQSQASNEPHSPSGLKPRLFGQPSIVPITVDATTDQPVAAAEPPPAAAAPAHMSAVPSPLTVPGAGGGGNVALATPRVWTPKPRRMSAMTAMAQEMEELDPNFAGMVPRGRRTSSCAGAAPTTRPSLNKNNSYKNAYYNKAFEEFDMNPNSTGDGAAPGTLTSSSAEGRVYGGGSGLSPPTSLAGGVASALAPVRKRTMTSGGGAISTPRPSVMRGNLFAEDNGMPQLQKGPGSESGGWSLIKSHRQSKDNVTTVRSFYDPDPEPTASSSSKPGYGSILATANTHASSSSPLAPGSRNSSAAPSPVPRSWSPAMGNSYTPAAYEADMRSLIGSGKHMEALMRHGPTSGLARCYIKRYKNLLGTHWSCQVYLESWDQLLLAARRRKKSANSKYLLALTTEETNRDSDKLVAKLRSDFMGKSYTLWQKGGNPAGKKGFGAQSVAISYKPTATSVKCSSRTLSVAVTLPDEEEWVAGLPVEGPGSLVGCLAAAQDRSLGPQQERHLAMLHTIKPFYDHNKKVHYLDFKGRVTKASLKNFQLVHWDHNSNQLGTDMVLLFGKKGEDEYAMDFAYPLNLLQATALALSSIDTKLSTTL